ncbi:MAG: heme exporter protein CcmD [Vibrionaceae bacterium]
MQFASFVEFIEMGGYSAYVWPALGFTVLAFIWLIIDAVLTRRKLKRMVKERAAREQRLELAKQAKDRL